MKQLLADDIEVIQLSDRRTMTAGRIRKFKPFGLFFTYDGFSPFDIFMLATLKNGNTYLYSYTGGPTDVESSRVVNICLHFPDPGYVGFTGGRYFNPFVRPLLLNKELSP